MNALLLSLSLALAAQDAAPPEPDAPAEPAEPEAALADDVEEAAGDGGAPVDAVVERGLAFDRDEGVIALGAGLGLSVASAIAFQAGNEQERRLRAGEATGEAADEALFRRGVAAWIAWPAAVLAVASVGAGAWILGSHELAKISGEGE